MFCDGGSVEINFKNVSLMSVDVCFVLYLCRDSFSRFHLRKVYIQEEF